MRTALITLTVATVMVAGLFTAGYVTNDHSILSLHRYSGTNAGVFIDLPAHHWCGFEYRGSPGAFCDVS